MVIKGGLSSQKVAHTPPRSYNPLMIRTRFAPSPTGYLHVGSLRTALYCYLFAKANKGKFILRIEDTDQERFVEGAIENLIKILDWAELKYDEGPILKNGKVEQKGDYGPYIQSQRFDLYKKYADELIQKGQAYYCFCTKERLDDLRQSQEAKKQATMYDRKCLSIPLEEALKRVKAGEPNVVRQKIPYELLKFKDEVRGHIQFDGKTIDDQVLIKSDGFPTYHLANVVDDHLMGITHVIRGEEWLPSTPKHIFLYKSFGWQQPIFAHIPLLLNKDRSKLSKRQGHVSVEEYIEEGYLREAIINFTALLGWHPGAGEENELFSLKDLEKLFSLERVHKAGAIFEIEKLNWFNWLWQKRLFNEQMDKEAKTIEPKIKITEIKPGVFSYQFSKKDNQEKFLIKKAVYLYKLCEKYIRKELKENPKQTPAATKISSTKKLQQTPNQKTQSTQKLQQIPPPPKLSLLYKALLANEEKVLKETRAIDQHIEYFFKLPDYDRNLLTHEKMQVDLAQAKISLEKAKENLQTCEGKNWSEENLKEQLLKLIEKLGLKTGQLLWPIRAALTGQQLSPGAFEMLWALGKQESLNRIESALKKLRTC